MLDQLMYAFILDQLQQAALVVDRGGTIRLANARVESLLGMPTKYLLDQSLPALTTQRPDWLHRLGFTAEDLEVLLYQLATGDWSVQQEEQRYSVSEPYTLHIHRTHTLLTNSHGEITGLLFVFTDITPAQELYRTHDHIVSLIVHDLRSPLTAVTSSLRLLKDMAEPHDDFGRAVLRTSEIASRAVKKLLNMVNGLLDVFKMESGIITLEREAVDIQELLKGVVTELRPLAHEMDVYLVEEVLSTDPIPVLDIDADKIERVFYNLLDNAIKFTPSEGEITVRIYEPNKGFLRLDIQDTGSGIPATYKTKLFDRYEQMEETIARRRGTGLGLTFCKLAVEAHGGQIWIEDNPTGGAIFSLTLPILTIS